MEPQPVKNEKMEKPAGNQKVEFNFVHLQGYATSHVDGIAGGITPQGEVYMAFYAEHAKIPSKVMQEFSPEGRAVQPPVAVNETHAQMTREISHGVIMKIETAKNIIGWLNQVIGEIEKSQKANG